MVILGIDPGLRRTGFGLIRAEGPSGPLVYLTSGVIEPQTSGDMASRLGTLHGGLTSLIDQHSPQFAALEQVFLNRNPRTTLLLGQARGAVLAALSRVPSPVLELSPTEIKQSVVGTGRAAKEQVQVMVRHLLKLSAAPSPDAADALACAIAAWHRQTSPLFSLQAASQGRRS